MLEISASFSIDDSINANLQNGGEEISASIGETTQLPSNDYNNLIHLPTLNGNVIKGNIVEEDPTVSSWAKKPEKPQYTANEIGAVPAGSAISLEEIDSWFNNL